MYPRKRFITFFFFRTAAGGFGPATTKHPGPRAARSHGVLPTQLRAGQVCGDIPGRVRHPGGEHALELDIYMRVKV